MIHARPVVEEVDVFWIVGQGDSRDDRLVEEGHDTRRLSPTQDSFEFLAGAVSMPGE